MSAATAALAEAQAAGLRLRIVAGQLAHAGAVTPRQQAALAAVRALPRAELVAELGRLVEPNAPQTPRNAP